MFGWLSKVRAEEVGLDHLVFIDETGIDERDPYAYGWSMQGERCLAKRSGKRGQRLSLISAVLGNQPQQLIEPYVFSGHCERTWVERWLEHFCQSLQQGEKHYLILDNALFQIGQKHVDRA